MRSLKRLFVVGSLFIVSLPPLWAQETQNETNSQANGSWHPFASLDSFPPLWVQETQNETNSQANGSWHPFASLDYFDVGNAKTTAQNTLNAQCQELRAQGYYCGGSGYVNVAYGGRIGMFRSVDGFNFGPSLGYLYGGPSLLWKANITVKPAGNASQQFTDNTLRLLMEGNKKFPINNDWSFALGAGIGLALDLENDSYSCSGSLTPYCPANSNSNFGWLTWEISPAFDYRQYSFGLRYAGFARGGDVPWNTVGAFAGYSF